MKSFELSELVDEIPEINLADNFGKFLAGLIEEKETISETYLFSSFKKRFINYVIIFLKV